jgi:hypothetical protein
LAWLRLRLLGAAVGAFPGLIIAIPTSGNVVPPLTIGSATILAATPIGVVLGWLFAPTAVRPGWRPALAAGIGFAFLAILIGAYAAAGLAMATTASPGDGLSGTFLVGTFGLLFLGLPLGLLILPIALVWVGTVRMIHGRLSIHHLEHSHSTSDRTQ